MKKGKTLVMTEKFDQAKALAPVLGVRFIKGKNYAEGEDFVLCWGQGHLLDALMPAGQNPSWGGKWDVERLPMIPPVKMKCGPDKRTGHLLSTIATQMRRSDVTEILCGTDADREGVLIFHRVLDHANVDKPVRYLVYHDLTAASLKAAVADPKDASEMTGMVKAAYLRAWADWVIGLNLTQGFSARFDDSIDVGRVMIPTLTLIKKRYDAISAFKPADYWVIEGVAKTGDGSPFPVRYDAGKGEHPGRITDKKTAKDIFDAIVSGIARVKSVAVTEDIRENPYLFAMNTLQIAASGIGINASASMRAAQSIYSSRHLITYPRTETPFINYQVMHRVPGAIRAISGLYPELAGEALAEIEARNGRKNDWFKCVWPDKVRGHHGIVATNMAPGQLSGDEKKVHDLVCRRFLAAFMRRATCLDTDVTLEAGGHVLRASGRTWTDKGWMKAEPWRDANDRPLPDMSKNAVVTLDLNLVKRTTKPPTPMTEAELLDLMKTAGKLVEDEDLAAAMAENGIGRSATRTPCIQKLVDIEYATRKGKVMGITPGGDAKATLVAATVPEVSEPDMTGTWEVMLNKIEAGENDGSDFEKSITDFVTKAIGKIKEAGMQEALPPSAGVGACPDCGAGVVDSRMHYVCSARCGFRFFKKWGGIRLTQSMVSEILGKGGTSREYLFSKAGKKGGKQTHFEAGLELAKDETTEKSFVRYRFKDWEALPPVGKCPKCGKNVFENHAVFACEDKDGCGFAMYKSTLGGRLTRDIASQLLSDGVTRFKVNLWSKNTRKKYTSKLAISKDDHRVVLAKYA